ncbi:MAG: hypothetical protein ACYSUN_09820, partial [Planctomycetota bacterium]
GQKALSLSDSPLWRASWQYRMLGTNLWERAVELRVRLEPASTEGVEVVLKGETRLLSMGSGRVRLIIAPPKRVGPFEGTITIYCDEVPEWSFSYPFQGEVVDRPYDGRHIRIKPAGVDLGPVRAGEAKRFAVMIRNDGSENITISEVRPSKPRMVRLERNLMNTLLAPGDEVELAGKVQAPPRGAFSVRVAVASTATNAPVREIVVSGVVAEDHTAEPPRLRWKNVYAGLQRKVSLVISAAEGVAPFRVAAIDSLEPYLEVVEGLGGEAATKQKITLRLKKGAPKGAVRLDLGFKLEPAGVTLLWPVEMNVVPSIDHRPKQANFGKVTRGSDPVVQIEFFSIAGRDYEVKSAKSRRGRFIVETRHTQGLAWRIRVKIPPGSPAGVLRDIIVVETDDPDTPGIHIPAYAEIR